MKKNINKKHINAFSLTEVLVTMFIIMLVIIASAPMITKKNIKNKAPHGVWECTLNENGTHTSTLTIDGIKESPVTYSTAYCLFEPQKNAEEYSITVIGGGGGGASAAVSIPDAVSYGNAVTYKIPETGRYDVLLIGGGGGGSPTIHCPASNFACRILGRGSGGNYGGGSGAVRILLDQQYEKDNTYILEAGHGGEGGGNGDKRCLISWKDENCKGLDGKASRFYKFGGSENVADGGKGGERTKGGQGGGTIYSSKQHGSYQTGGSLYASNNSQLSKIEQFIGSSASYMRYGQGGNGTSTMYGEPGVNGIVMLKSRSFHVGGGGHQGNAAYMTLKNLKDPVRVYVGQGGAGAVTENNNGESGENSSFGSYIVAKGGDGGERKAASSTDESAVLNGKNGSMSPYGGILSGGNSSNLNGQNDMGDENTVDITQRGITAASETTYGAGGGGGAGKSRVNCDPANGYAECWGKGGRGMPGYVRVEWN